THRARRRPRQSLPRAPPSCTHAPRSQSRTAPQSEKGVLCPHVEGAPTAVLVARTFHHEDSTRPSSVAGTCQHCPKSGPALPISPVETRHPQPLSFCFLASVRGRAASPVLKFTSLATGCPFYRQGLIVHT